MRDKCVSEGVWLDANWRSTGWIVKIFILSWFPRNINTQALFVSPRNTYLNFTATLNVASYGTRLCVGESAEAFTFLFLWHTLMSSTSRDTELSSFSLFCVLSETFYYAVIEEEDRSLQSRKRLERDTATNRETDGDKHEYTDNKTHTRYYGRTIWR